MEPDTVTPHALVCYNFIDGLTEEEEATLMASDPALHILATIDWNLVDAEYQVDPTQVDPIPVDPTLELTHQQQLCIQHTVGTMPIDEAPI